MTEKIDNKIWSFIGGQTLFTFATSFNDAPYCCSCFYSLDQNQKILIFKSGSKTQHLSNIKTQLKIAGSNSSDLLEKGPIRRVQFTGKVKALDHDVSKRMLGLYHKNYTRTRTMKGISGFIQFEHVKMTECNLGISKKRIWNHI